MCQSTHEPDSRALAVSARMPNRVVVFPSVDVDGPGMVDAHAIDIFTAGSEDTARTHIAGDSEEIRPECTVEQDGIADPVGKARRHDEPAGSVILLNDRIDQRRCYRWLISQQKQCRLDPPLRRMGLNCIDATVDRRALPLVEVGVHRDSATSQLNRTSDEIGRISKDKNDIVKGGRIRRVDHVL